MLNFFKLLINFNYIIKRKKYFYKIFKVKYIIYLYIIYLQNKIIKSQINLQDRNNNGYLKIK